jgi:hypothetical protein
MAEFLRIHRLFNRPWDVEPRRRFTLSSLTGITPEREPWWASPRVKELMENPDAAHEKQSAGRAELERSFVSLENPQWKAMIIPRLGGRIWRLYHKRTKQDILWRGAIPRDLLARGADPTRYVNFGGYEEYAGEKFASPGWAEAYECKPSAEGQAVTLVASLPSGLRLTRKVALMGDGIEIESALENASPKTVSGVMLRVHPEFALKPGEGLTELRLKGPDGKWTTIPFKSESALSGKQLPAGAWGLALPKAGMTVTNEFDPAQVGACFPYLGKEFFNLELFSPKKDLAPGEGLRMKQRYLVVLN